ncbi:N-acetylneuraminate synthase family protein [Patescibacteria group bacterium]|nr:N-acetylneuraminate synthase family protein [Patescibacteria group bacterium]
MFTKKNIKQRPLFIFEMANNHGGVLAHGLKILREFDKIREGFDFAFAFKLQYRDIPSFIHPDYKNRKDLKYVKRFSETRMTEETARALKKEIDKLGFITICTPFDEKSVDLIEKQNYDIIKIGSCSAPDWPLLERIAKTDKPIIVSVAGVSLKGIDSVVSFFQHRKKDFVLMHCVGQYPTPRKALQLNQIDLLKKRYPQVEVGYSTHEDPDNFDSIKLAIAKGATVFEKHVGIKSEKIGLNNYSATPQQIKQWLTSAKTAFDSCGGEDKRMSFSKKELADLKQFRRGVFAKKEIEKGQKLDSSNVFYAWPNIDGQILATDMSKYMDYRAKRKINKNAAVMSFNLSRSNDREKVYKIIVEARKMLSEAKIALPDKLEIEVSHHYGINDFYKCGAVIINCINRDYCKKLIILFPGQSHPTHFHKRKEETFQVLHGNMRALLGDEELEHKAGDMILVPRGVKHNFGSKNGAIFEEISTTHYKDDSFYDDKNVIKNKYRKTQLTYWQSID